MTVTIRILSPRWYVDVEVTSRCRTPQTAAADVVKRLRQGRATERGNVLVEVS